MRLLVVNIGGSQRRPSARNRRRRRSDLEIPEFRPVEERLQRRRTSEGGRSGRRGEAMDFAAMAPHVLSTGAQVPAPGRRAAGAGDDGRRSRRGQRHPTGLEEVKVGDGGQQALSLVAVCLVSVAAGGLGTRALSGWRSAIRGRLARRSVRCTRGDWGGPESYGGHRYYLAVVMGTSDIYQHWNDFYVERQLDNRG